MVHKIPLRFTKQAKNTIGNISWSGNQHHSLVCDLRASGRIQWNICIWFCILYLRIGIKAYICQTNTMGRICARYISFIALISWDKLANGGTWTPLIPLKYVGWLINEFYLLCVLLFSLTFRSCNCVCTGFLIIMLNGIYVIKTIFNNTETTPVSKPTYMRTLMPDADISGRDK